MIPALKAEFRKLRSVRSTYGIFIVALGFCVLISGYAKGYKLSGHQLSSHLVFQDSIMTTVSITAVFGALVALLLITHEYRYNTVLYTLAASRSRFTPLLAKVVVVSLFSLALAMVISLLAPLLSQIGAALAGHSLPAQDLYFGDLTWRVLFYAWGYSIIALLIGAILRNQVVALVTFFIFPTTVEGLLSLLLKDNTTYLPFSALGTLISESTQLIISPGKAAIVFMIYIVAGLALALFLIQKRDAN